MSVALELKTATPLTIGAKNWPKAQQSIEQLREKSIAVEVTGGTDKYQVSLSYKDYARRSAPLEVHCLIEDLGAFIEAPVKIHFCEGNGPNADFFIAATAEEIRRAVRRDLIGKAAAILHRAGVQDLAMKAEQLAACSSFGA